MKSDQAEIRRIIDVLKGQVDQTLELVIVMSNLQHAIAEHVGPPPGFTFVTHPMYDLPHDYAFQQVDVPTQPKSMHIPVSNEVLMALKTPIVHNNEGNPQFTMNVPNSQSAHLVTKVKHSQVAEVAEICHDLEKRLRVMEGFSILRLDEICLVSDLVIPLKFKVTNFEKYKGDRCPRHHLVFFYLKMIS